MNFVALMKEISFICSSLTPIFSLKDYETFGPVFLDNHRARIYVVFSDRIEDMKIKTVLEKEPTSQRPPTVK